MNPYQSFVFDFAQLLERGSQLPLGGSPPLPRPPIVPGAGKALIFSPHPDDEVIIGALPLRLLRECGMNVINVAVTQGSNKARRAERLKELTACCDHLGFGLIQTCEGGLEGINLEARAQNPAAWSRSVERIAAILEEHQPQVIFFPHDDDWNITHIGTHHLVVEALGLLKHRVICHAVETEFWGAMDKPNLTVESSPEDVADLIAALSFHVGEVRRNPYHVRLPAWLIDNVRRGGELVGGQGAAAPDFPFATLYRLRQWNSGRFKATLTAGRFLSRAENPMVLWQNLPAR